MILHTAHHLRIGACSDIWYTDATDGLLRKSKDIFSFSIVGETVDKTSECVSVSDFLTAKMCVEDIAY